MPLKYKDVFTRPANRPTQSPAQIGRSMMTRRPAARGSVRDMFLRPGDQGRLEPIGTAALGGTPQLEFLGQTPRQAAGLVGGGPAPLGPATQMAQANNPTFQAWDADQDRQRESMLAGVQQERRMDDLAGLGQERMRRVQERLSGRNIANQQARGPSYAGGGYVQTDPNEPATFLGSGRTAAAGADAAIAQGEAWRRMGGREDQRMVAPGARFAPEYNGRDLAREGRAMMSVPDPEPSLREVAFGSQATNPQVGAAAAGESAIPRSDLRDVRRAIAAYRQTGDADLLTQQIGQMGFGLEGLDLEDRDPARGFTVRVRNGDRTMTIPVPSQEQEDRWASREGSTAARASVRGLAQRTGIDRDESESFEEYHDRLRAAGRTLRQEVLDRREQNRDAYFQGRSERQELSGRELREAAFGSRDDDDDDSYGSPSGPAQSARERFNQLSAATREATRIAGGETFQALGFDASTSPDEALAEAERRIEDGEPLSDPELREIWQYVRVNADAGTNPPQNSVLWQYMQSTQNPTVAGFKQFQQSRPNVQERREPTSGELQRMSPNERRLWIPGQSR